MWFRRKRSRDEDAPVERPERRARVRWCSSCRSGAGPYVYLENGKHYCRPCSIEARNVMRLRPAGRRKDDITDI